MSRRRPSKPPTTDPVRKFAIQAAANLEQQFGAPLTHQERMEAVNAFRRSLLPGRKPGRKRSDRVTAAHEDWKRGMGGVELYRKHIPGYSTLSRWRRECEVRRLRESIRTRERREKQRRTIGLCDGKSG